VRQRSRHEINGGFDTTHNRNTGLAVGFLILGAVLAATPAAASTFDGSWNVNITTRTGTCQSGASFPIRISNGRVESGSAVAVSGRVADSGGIESR
jgi:hypothetical protein